MREIKGQQIIEAVKSMCMQASTDLPQDVSTKMQCMYEREPSEGARDILKIIQENAKVARELKVPMCQDTGLTVVFVEIGQEVCVRGGSMTEFINEGVRQGYDAGYLRKSVVSDPINRVNTGDNTPAVIHYEIIEGDSLNITVAPKGFGSENMSRLLMLKPSEGIEGVKRAIIETIEIAGSNPCPPIVVGVGIGGTFEKAAILSKKALMRDLGISHENAYYESLEQHLLDEINSLGIGPQGFGGRTTALGVHIETAPTHIAGLPVAINIGCHASRHVSCEL